MADNKKVCIIGGGTFYDVRAHFSLAAPAFGTTARQLYSIGQQVFPKMDLELYTTMMAGNEKCCHNAGGSFDYFNSPDRPNLRTNEDVAKLVDELVGRKDVKIIFFNPAMCDWEGEVFDVRCEDSDAMASGEGGKYGRRLSTHDLTPDPVPEDAPDWVKAAPESPPHYLMTITPAEKIISRIRKERKDIFLVAFKQTTGATENEQYLAGLDLCKRSSCNLVLANDTKTRLNMIVTPEEARYCVTDDREKALWELSQMAFHRSHLTFTRSTVVDGYPVSWDSDLVPDTLRAIVNFCIKQGAYRPFNGVTAGHFAVRLSENEFLSSIRKTNFNYLPETGMVKVETDGPDTVLAYGAKPSVGGQSQRMVFRDHPGYDCIVHFHCPMLENPRDEIPVASQREFECGSHECGGNTSNNLGKFGNLKAVFLSDHGPNIVFPRSVKAEEVIDFITANFDLSRKTGGYVSTSEAPKLETVKCDDVIL